MGNEYESTVTAANAHMVPMLREHGIRFMQVARGGQAAEHGYDVLADSLAPTEVIRRGAWHLGQEMDEALTVPRIVTGRRECSARAKGEVLDAAIADEIAAGNVAPGYRHVIAYAAELCCGFVICPLSTVRGPTEQSLVGAVGNGRVSRVGGSLPRATMGRWQLPTR